MRKFSVSLIFILAVIVLGSNAYAQISSATVLFLRIAAGARPAGMGEAYVAIADDATASHWNPAGLGQYPLAPKWFSGEIPEYLKPLRAVALFEGAGSGEDYQKYDIWAISSDGLVKFSDDKWVNGDILSTKADQTLEMILNRYTGLIGSAADEKIPALIEHTALLNNEFTVDKIDSLQNLVMSFLDTSYSARADLDTAFAALKGAYNECHIDWKRFLDAQELVQKAVRDSSINETEADRTLFILEKAQVRFLPREITIPYSINFDGELKDLASSDNYLWVASDSGLYRYNGEKWQRFGENDGLLIKKINKLKVYDERVFLATDTGVIIYHAGGFTHYGPEQGLPHKKASSFSYIDEDRYWAVVDNDLYQFDGTTWRNYIDAKVKMDSDGESIYENMKIYDSPAEKERYLEKYLTLNIEQVSIEITGDKKSDSMTVVDALRLTDSLGVISAIDIIHPTVSDSLAMDTLLADTDKPSVVVEDSSGIEPSPDDTVLTQSSKIPYTAGFEFEVLDMEVDQYGSLWIGTTYGLLKFVGRKWIRYGYRDYTPRPEILTAEVPNESDSTNDSTNVTVPVVETLQSDYFEMVFDIALDRVAGDTTRAERLANNIRKVNHLQSDSVAADQTIKIYANPSGAAINDIQMDGNKIYFATSSGTIQFDGIWSRFKERNLGKKNTVSVIEKSNNVWFITPDKIEIIARTRSEIAGMHVQLVPELADDIYYEFLGYVQNIEGWGTIGGNITFLSYGKVIRTDASAHVLGEFYPFEFAFTLSYGTKLTKNLSAGVSAKVIYSHLSTIGAGRELGSGTSTGLALDFGLLYRINNRLTMGMALTNLGPEVSYIDVSQADPLPRNLAIGLAWKMIKSSYNEVLFTIDANKSLADRDKTILEDLRDVITSPQTELKGLFFNPFSIGNWSKEFRNVIINAGIEYKYGQFIAFRGGYIHDEIGDIKTPTLGVGLAISVFKFDLAYIPTSDENPGVSNTMKMSITANW